MLTPALFACILVIAVGGLILWSNPARKINRAVGVSSFVLAAWLGSLHVAVVLYGALYWLRFTVAVGGLVPLSFWFVKESILENPIEPTWTWLRKNWGWLAVTVVLVATPYTDAFIPSHSSPTQRLRGWAYYAHMWLLLGMYSYMLWQAFRHGRLVVGSRRMELQIWLGGSCAMALSVIVTMALNALLNNRVFIRIQPLFVMFFYGGLALAITTNRIFNARQILLIAGEKSLLVGIVATIAFFLNDFFANLVPESIAFFATTAIALWLGSALNGWLNRKFQFYPKSAAARQAAFMAARTEVRFESLQAAFVGVLKGWGQTETVVLLSGPKDSVEGNGSELTLESAAIEALRELRWATPERLARQRATEGRRILADWLSVNDLGAVVLDQGPTLVAVVGTGIPVSRRPYTYPQITELMELASIIENALERAHFSVKAQHAEQLATVGLLGASLAHEIRNPLVTIKTFVQLLPNHYQDAAFRDKFFHLIGDEVTRIDRLTEQLLDLASPRAYHAQEMELHPVLRTSLELVAAKAADKHIEFVVELNAAPDRVMMDASAVKQVLINLCFNAIQAVEKQETSRWIKLSTGNAAGGVEMVVEDSGPGISPSIRPRLFQPFQSTKSSGFGLGLAICSDILADLDATIAVDPSEPGRGATFRVLFPCQV